MSAFQYYEFQAVDVPLTQVDQAALRAISTRARITGTSFVNTYDYGDLKANPLQMMRSWFDLHLYLANWGTHRLMMRFPKRLVDVVTIRTLLGEVDDATLHVDGDVVILDVARDDEDPDDDWDDGSGWLSALAPLRADVLGGDLRLFYLLWLTAVEADAFEEDYPEPLPGIGPLSGALRAFAEFFRIDPDLVEAAAEHAPVAQSPSIGRDHIKALDEGEKTDLLLRLFDGDPHVAAELRARIRAMAPPSGATQAPRTIGTLRARAKAMRVARERALAEAAAAERRREAEEAKKARQARLDAVRRRGDSVWREIETEIEQSNKGGYERAARLLGDVRILADDAGTIDAFIQRVAAIRNRHAKKTTFITRLEQTLGL